jgi:hypothetical protein
MDAYRFAISFTPILTPQDISKLAQYKVTSPDNIKSVVDRIRAVKYEKEDVNPSITLIFQFLSDEEEGKKQAGKSATAYRAQRLKQEEANNAEAVAREKRRDALRANMTISSGISCLADQYMGHQEITYITKMYANNTNIAIITSYIQNSRICYLSRRSYPAKNFTELNGIGQLVTLKSKKPTDDGNYIFIMVHGKDWNVD